ncbi:hypothetical protein NL676_007954 [Syzygium grande]|nr:hypothetical protein NL676_007954 [Syzygium grande]
MSIPKELYPSQDDLLYEEELLRNPFSLKLWWRYLIARADSPFKKRFVIYERALKALPGSYKLWHAYLRERLEIVRNLPVSHSQYETLNNTFERALVTMHKMPRIWIMYLLSLTEQKLITRTEDHDRIWEPYPVFISQKGMPIETPLSVYRRYLKYDHSHIEDFIEFLVNSSLWQEAAERLASVLNDDQFFSIKGKTKHRLWLELCDLLMKHATEVSGLNVDAIIRGGIRKFSDEVGRLWTSLAEYYIRRNLHEKARDIFEEGMKTVITVRDFSVIFDAYAQFEESVLAYKMENMDLSDEDEGRGRGWDIRLDVNLSVAKFEKKILDGFWLHDDKDVDLRLARLEHLMVRRPELANSVLLRQNPHNVEQWHRKVKLFEGNPTKQILTYTEAVRTVDPMKAVGKPHTLWVAFAKLSREPQRYRQCQIFGVSGGEMELRHNNFKKALELMRRAIFTERSVEVKRRVAADGNEPVQIKVHKSLRLWTFYVDLESTRAVYEHILDLRIATPQIIINYAVLLEDNKYFEDAFKVYERGVKIFKYPHVKDIWVTYLSKFVRRYGKTKLERARELFEHAIEMTPSDQVKPLYLQYAKLEAEYGLAKRAMKVYDQATKAVPSNEKLAMYEIYIARAAEIFKVPKTREIYEQAIENGGLPDKDGKAMCLKYAELEKSLGEIDRARGIYVHLPRNASDKRSVSASYSQTHFILPEYVMQKDQKMDLDDVRDKLKQAGVSEDEMAALERQLVPSANDVTTRDGGIRSNVNQEDIELPDESDLDEEDRVEIAQKDVTLAVIEGWFPRGKTPKRTGEGKDGESRLGALERELKD